MLDQPIETIIFDLDGTLRRNVPSADETQFNFALELGVIDQPGLRNQGARWTHYYWAQSLELQEDIGKYGNDLSGEFWAYYSYRYLRALSVPEERATELALPLFQAMQDGFRPESQVVPDAFETLQTLKDSGFGVGLVSNRSRPCHEECEHLGLLPYFDFAYVAAEVDAWKPDPRIFNRALEITGTHPRRTIYVGDNYFADINGAKNAGIQPVLIDPDGIFPDADCAVIKSIGGLVEILGMGGK
jgi:HAD superfamily hydrolase (TIGR01549 family)